MNVRELSKDQLLELKQSILTERNYANGEGTSYGELAEADSLVSDEEVFAMYDGTVFSDDDFLCTAGTGR